MTEQQKNRSTELPPGRDQPRGDRGHDDKTWEPPPGEQGISNRPDDAGVAAEDESEDTADE